MESEEFDKIIMRYFAIFPVIEYIIQNGKLCVSELQKNPSLHEKLYSKSISTLRRKLNTLVERGLLSKESTREQDTPEKHDVYFSTPKLESMLISISDLLFDVLHKPRTQRMGYNDI